MPRHIAFQHTKTSFSIQKDFPVPGRVRVFSGFGSGVSCFGLTWNPVPPPLIMSSASPHPHSSGSMAQTGPAPANKWTGNPRPNQPAYSITPPTVELVQCWSHNPVQTRTGRPMCSKELVEKRNLLWL